MNKIAQFLTKNGGIKHEELSFRKNETLFFEGDLCDHISVVLSGKVSIISYFDDGKEVVYNTIGKGGMFGNNLIFSSEPYYRGDVVANEDTEIAYISKNDLLESLSSKPEFLNLYLQLQSDFSKTLNFKIKLLTIDGAKERLMYYLTFNNNKVEYKSVTKLAKELYLTRETLSRTLSKLQNDGVIEIANKTIVLK